MISLGRGAVVRVIDGVDAAHGPLSGLLFGIRPLDPATFAGVALLLATIGAAACALPAVAAGRVDPRESLKAE